MLVDTPPEFPSRLPNGPQDAAKVGWTYHLVVKGFNNSSRDSSIRAAVCLFLDGLFGFDAEPPVEYAYHKDIEVPADNASRVLRFSLAKNSRFSITTEEALQRFCDKFFEQVDHANCNKMTDYGRLGFAPEDETFKLYWYNSMFRWMHDLRADKLLQMDHEVSLIQNRSDSKIRSWFPVWAGAALLTVSLGTSSLFSLRTAPRRGVRGAASSYEPLGTQPIRVADEILKRIAGSSDNAADAARDASVEAKACCSTFMEKSDQVIEMMKGDQGTAGPEGLVHRMIVERLALAIESAFTAVTACKISFDCFLEIRNSSLAVSMFALADASVSGYNAVSAIHHLSQVSKEPLHFTDSFLDKSRKFFGVIKVTPGEAQAIKDRAQELGQLRVEGIWAGVEAAYGLYRFARAAHDGYTAHQEKSMWVKVALYLQSGVRHMQVAELFINWIYNAGDGRQGMSPRHLEALERMTRRLHAALPTDEERTPEGIRARLIQQAETLRSEKEDVRKALKMS